ncbi:hypothetical protein C8J57DRAFT_1240023 [Mycena rebaudengoi]|nr:hypothetical protein C8J57DRAFT_1240023 [Mycena rebaudengoi]
MPKLSRAQQAAKARHRTRRGESDPSGAAALKEDGNYMPSDLDDILEDHVSETDSEIAEAVKEGKKRKRDDADLTHNFPLGGSTSSQYRERTGKTKKSCAAKFQPSISSFFSKTINTFKKPRQSTPPHGGDSDIEFMGPATSTSSLITVPMDIDGDSDIEEIPAPSIIQSEAGTETSRWGSPELHEFMSDPKDDSLGLPRPSPKVFLPPSPTVDEPTSPAPATPDPLASSLPVNDAKLAGTSADAKGLNSISDEAAIKDDLKTPKETHT